MCLKEFMRYLTSYSRNSDFFYGVRTWLRALTRKTKFWVCGISASTAGQRVQIRIKGHASQVLLTTTGFLQVLARSSGSRFYVSATLIYTHVNLSPNRRPANPVYNQSSESTVDLWFSEFSYFEPRNLGPGVSCSWIPLSRGSSVVTTAKLNSKLIPKSIIKDS